MTAELKAYRPPLTTTRADAEMFRVALQRAWWRCVRENGLVRSWWMWLTGGLVLQWHRVGTDRWPYAEYAVIEREAD